MKTRLDVVGDEIESDNNQDDGKNCELKDGERKRRKRSLGWSGSKRGCGYSLGDEGCVGIGY